MLALDIIVLFVAIPALGAGDADRSVVVLLQFILAADRPSGCWPESTWLRAHAGRELSRFPLLARMLPGLLPQATTLTLVFAYNLLVTAAMARAVFGPGDVNHHRIAGAVFIYLNVGLLFAVAYSGLQICHPRRLRRPVRPQAVASCIDHDPFQLLDHDRDRQQRDCAGNRRSPTACRDLQTITGQLFPAILLSRLVGLHISRTHLEPDRLQLRSV